MARLRVDLESETAYWGEAIRGTVVVETSGQAVRVRGVRAELPDVAAGKECPGPVTWELAEGTTLRPTEARAIPFAVPLPWRPIREKRASFLVQVTWNEHAPRDAERHALHEQSIRRAVHLAPPPALVRLVRGLAVATETEFFAWRELEDGGGVGAQFYPREHAARLFDSLWIGLHRRNNVFYGHLLVNLPERSAADRLRAAMGLDRRRVPVALPGGSVGQARAYFRDLLRHYVAPGRELPVPSAAPTSELEDLPLPSGEPDLNPDDLPRPHDEQTNEGFGGAQP